MALGMALGALGYLIVVTLGSTASYYVTVAEARQHATQLAGQPVRVQGVVRAGSVEYDNLGLRLQFLIEDPDDAGQWIRVAYRGARPDGLEPGRTVIAEGQLEGREAIRASTLLVQCPSRYEAEIAGPPAAGT